MTWLLVWGQGVLYRCVFCAYRNVRVTRFFFLAQNYVGFVSELAVNVVAVTERGSGSGNPNRQRQR